MCSELHTADLLLVNIEEQHIYWSLWPYRNKMRLFNILYVLYAYPFFFLTLFGEFSSLLLLFWLKEAVSGPFTVEETSLSSVRISWAASQWSNFSPLTKEQHLVEQIAVLLTTKKKGKSPICSPLTPLVVQNELKMSLRRAEVWTLSPSVVATLCRLS